MFCVNCGTKAKLESYIFCTNCGAKLQKTAENPGSSSVTTEAPPPPPEKVTAAPTPSESPDDLVILQIIPSVNDPVTVASSRLFLDALYHHDGETIRLGLAGDGSTGEVFLAGQLRRGFIPTFENVVGAYFPSTEFQVVKLQGKESSGKNRRFFYQSEHESFRLTCVTDLQPDPYSTLVTAFANLKPGEVALYDVALFRFEPRAAVFRKLGYSMALFKDGLAEAPAYDGERITGNMADFQKKSESSLWLSGVQLTIHASDESTAAVTTAVEQFHARFASKRTQLNLVEPKKDPDGTDDFVSTTRMLCTDEVVGLVHFPHKSLQHTALLRVNSANKAAPDILTKDGVAIGYRTTRGQTVTVRIPAEERTRHVYMIGKSGSGKSTCLLNMIRQDIEQGAGVAVIDPHGDLCEELLNFIPLARVPDAIYFNAADRTAPIALNVMSASDDMEIATLADDLIVTFRRLSDGWGQRMEHILGFVFQTLLRVPGATLLDVRTILLNEAARQKMLRKITFPPILEFWRNEFPGYSKEALQPILSRMGKFALSPTLFGILGQTESRLDFFDVIQNKKILLANLSQGKIGSDTSQLLGSLLVSQIQLATMRRANLAKEAREPFYLYVDEFQNFTTSAFDKILSEARKYRLCLTMAHQYISQLSDDVRSSILNNTGTILMFPLGAQDASYLKSELGAFTPEDLVNLSFQDHEVLCRPPTKSSDTFKLQTLPPPTAPALSFSRAVIEHTSATYSTVLSSMGTADGVIIETTAVTVGITTPRVPAPAPRRETLTAVERILYNVKLAEYLSTQQIIELCYAHVSLSAQATAASRDLRQLVDGGNLKVQPFGRGNVYYTGRTCNPTTHNLAIRDLLVKILRSNYDVVEVDFNLNLKTILPDLFVSFGTSTGQLIKTLWEYDTGTEPAAEIQKKVARYAAYPEFSPIVCVVLDSARMVQLQASLPDAPLSYAVMENFTTVKDPVFHHGADGPGLLFPEAASATA